MSELRDLLLGLAGVIAEEAEQNPRFKRKLEAVLFSPASSREQVPEADSRESLSELLESRGEAALIAKVAAMKKGELDEQIRSLGIRGLSRAKMAEKRERLISHLLSCAAEKAGVSNALLPGEKTEGERKTSSKAAATDEAPAAPAQMAPPLPEKETKDDPPLPDPILVYHSDGKEGLVRQLKDLNTESLRAVIKKNRLDPRKLTARKKEASELIAFIADRVEARLTKGQVFAEV